MSVEEILIAEYGKGKVSIEKAKKSKDGTMDVRIISIPVTIKIERENKTTSKIKTKILYYMENKELGVEEWV